MHRQSGLSLVEIVLLILVVGVIASMAIPRFVSPDASSQRLAIDALAGHLASASVMNYAREQAHPGEGVPVFNCAQTVRLLNRGELPEGYSIFKTPLGTVEGDSAQCTLTGPMDTRAVFRAIHVDPAI
ncbi:MAG TPA: type II secretion system protein [Gammaproteobacteria bacterium]|nr:type II secretion system protein [Gammaproteobacteria bacterium]